MRALYFSITSELKCCRSLLGENLPPTAFPGGYYNRWLILFSNNMCLGLIFTFCVLFQPNFHPVVPQVQTLIV